MAVGQRKNWGCFPAQMSLGMAQQRRAGLASWEESAAVAAAAASVHAAGDLQLSA